MADDDGARWVSMGAAARALGISRQAVRGRIRRGTLETRTERAGNRERLLVRLPEQLPERLPEPVPEPFREGLPEPLPEPIPEHVAELVELRARVAEMAATLAAQRAHIDDLRAELQRRRWPGWVPWLRRALWGEGE